MAKMPKNDNLVMESIEDLFQQADIVSENPSSAPSQLSREKAGKIPIIGARAVTLEKDSPPGSDILVLAGQKRPLSEQSEPFFSAPLKKEGVAFNIKWDIVCKARPFEHGKRGCNLCNSEIFNMMSGVKGRFINHKDEIFSHGIHRKK